MSIQHVDIVRDNAQLEKISKLIEKVTLKVLENNPDKHLTELEDEIAARVISGTLFMDGEQDSPRLDIFYTALVLVLSSFNDLRIGR